MAKINQHDDIQSDKPERERKPAAKPKKNKSGGPASLSIPLQEKESAVVVPEVLVARKAEEVLTARIRQLESRLGELESLLAERSAELDAIRADTAAVAVLESQLRDKDDLLKAKDIAFKELEENLNVHIANLQNQLRAQEELMASREAEPANRELPNTEYEQRLQSQEMSDRIYKETERLISEQREAKLALAKVEMDEWHGIGRRNAWKRALGTVRKLFQTRREREDQTLKEQ